MKKMSKKVKGLHILSDATPLENLELAKMSIEAGVKEVHIGYDNCGMCGHPINGKVEGLAAHVNSSIKGKQTIHLHLCDDCWKIMKDGGQFKAIGKG